MVLEKQKRTTHVKITQYHYSEFQVIQAVLSVYKTKEIRQREVI